MSQCLNDPFYVEIQHYNIHDMYDINMYDIINHQATLLMPRTVGDRKVTVTVGDRKGEKGKSGKKHFKVPC